MDGGPGVARGQAVAGRALTVCPPALAALVMACGGVEGPAPRADGTSLTVLYPGDERVLGPAFVMPAQSLMFSTLVDRDETGELRGRLARSWEHSPDYRSWTIHLRKDVRWHDGVAFTAHDVEFTLDLFRHPEVLWESPDAYSVRVLDDSTFTITDERGCGINPLDEGTVYYPKHLLEELDPAEFAAWDFWTHPVGTGPFRYVRHVPKTMMELEANPDYYGGRPRIDRLTLMSSVSSCWFRTKWQTPACSSRTSCAAWASRRRSSCSRSPTSAACGGAGETSRR